LLLLGCDPAIDWDAAPRPADHQPPPGSQGLALSGPVAVFSGQPHTWQVTADDLEEGDEVVLAWGGAIGAGPCPFNRLVGGHLCVDIHDPAHPIAATTALRDASGEVVAVFEVAVPGSSRDGVYLQAMSVKGLDSATTNTLYVEMLRGPRCDASAGPFGGGTGVETDPFLICTRDQLAALSGVNGVHARLVSDLDLTDTGFDGLTLGSNSVFDGSGHAIRGYDNSGALFSQIQSSSTIRNLRVLGARISRSGGGDVGILVGFMRDFARIENVHVQGEVRQFYTGSGGTSYAGGVVGNAAQPTIVDVTADVEVMSQNAGGLVGRLNGGTLTRVHTEGRIVGAGNGTKAGGVVAELVTSSGDPTIRDSSSAATVIGGTSGAGGFIAALGRPGIPSHITIAHCFATGDVHGGRYVGGFVGSVTGGTIERSASYGDVTGAAEGVGGFAGTMESQGPIARDVVSTGLVHGSVRPNDCSVGGLVGRVASGEVVQGIVVPTVVWMNGVGSHDLIGGACHGPSNRTTDVYGIEVVPGGELDTLVDVSGAPEDPASYPALQFVDTWVVPTANPFTELRIPVPQSFCGRQGITCP
jgi:hypothetical protein